MSYAVVVMTAVNTLSAIASINLWNHDWQRKWGIWHITKCYLTAISLLPKAIKLQALYLPPTKEEVNAFARLCLSVSKITHKRVQGFGWNVACRQVSGTNWLTFEPYPDYNPDAGTGLLSPLSYKSWYAEFYVGKSRRIRNGRCSDAWFYLQCPYSFDIRLTKFQDNRKDRIFMYKQLRHSGNSGSLGYLEKYCMHIYNSIVWLLRAKV